MRKKTEPKGTTRFCNKKRKAAGVEGPLSSGSTLQYLVLLNNPFHPLSFLPDAPGTINISQGHQKIEI